MLTLTQAEVFPVRKEETGAWRVGDSRVLLEMVIQSYRQGATPEMIVQSFDTLALADVYAVITYALRRPSEIDAYLDHRERQAEDVWRRIDASQGDLGDIRRRLAARRQP